MSTVLYGIRQCDTIRKARTWLEQHGIDYRFHDYRQDGLDAALLEQLCQPFGWEALINKRGTTYRALDEATKAGLNATSARELMLQQPAIIKRPLLQTDQGWLLGFDAPQYQALLV